MLIDINDLIDRNFLKRNLKRLNTVVGLERTKSKELLTAQCLTCNFIWSNQVKSFFGNNNICPRCSGHIRITNEIMDQRLKDKKIRRIENYINNRTKIGCQCLTCLYIWNVFPSNIMKKDRKCPSCSGRARITNKILDEFLENRNIKRIGNVITGRDKILFQCTKDYCCFKWAAAPTAIINKNLGCLKCSNLIRINNLVMDEKLAGKNITRLGECKGSCCKFDVKCEACNQVWETSHALLTRNIGCPSCSNNRKQKNEKLFFKLLKDNNIDFEYQKSIKSISKPEMRNCKIDFYIPNINSIIEYNGAQHYSPQRFGGIDFHRAKENFKKQKKRDLYVKRFCKKNNIDLIIIDGRKYQNKKLEKYFIEEILPQLK